MTGAIVAVIVVVLVVSFGLLRRRRDGVGVAVSPDAGPVLDTRSLGVDLGPRATLVQFSSKVCAPCRVTKRILGELTALDTGLAHVDLDVDDHLALAVESHAVDGLDAHLPGARADHVVDLRGQDHDLDARSAHLADAHRIGS